MKKNLFLNMKKRIHVFISGKVQGVFFRKNTLKKAEEKELKGWVKNLSDGRVEAVFEGERIEEMLEWLEKGPSLAKVEKVKVKEEDYKGEFNNFKIKY